jgi:hypothetical protein
MSHKICASPLACAFDVGKADVLIEFSRHTVMLMCITSVSNVGLQSDAAMRARSPSRPPTPAAPRAGAATHDEPQHKRVRVDALLALQSRRAIQKIVSNRAQAAGTAGAPSAADARGADMFTVDTQLLFTITHIARV